MQIVRFPSPAIIRCQMAKEHLLSDKINSLIRMRCVFVVCSCKMTIKYNINRSNTEHFFLQKIQFAYLATNKVTQAKLQEMSHAEIQVFLQPRIVWGGVESGWVFSVCSFLSTSIIDLKFSHFFLTLYVAFTYSFIY